MYIYITLNNQSQTRKGITTNIKHSKDGSHVWPTNSAWGVRIQWELLGTWDHAVGCAGWLFWTSAGKITTRNEIAQEWNHAETLKFFRRIWWAVWCWDFEDKLIDTCRSKTAAFTENWGRNSLHFVSETEIDSSSAPILPLTETMAIRQPGKGIPSDPFGRLKHLQTTWNCFRFNRPIINFGRCTLLPCFFLQPMGKILAIDGWGLSSCLFGQFPSWILGMKAANTQGISMLFFVHACIW